MNTHETYKLHLDNQELVQKVNGMRDQLEHLMEQNKEWQDKNRLLVDQLGENKKNK